MEIKNLADCDSGIMMAMEIMARKAEMKTRAFVAEYGSGTALLLRLSQAWKGSGRLVVADSAFASVKSAVALKCKNGLYFHALVKTVHRKFPIDTRGGHVVVCVTTRGGRGPSRDNLERRQKQKIRRQVRSFAKTLSLLAGPRWHPRTTASVAGASGPMVVYRTILCEFPVHKLSHSTSMTRRRLTSTTTIGKDARGSLWNNVVHIVGISVFTRRSWTSLRWILTWPTGAFVPTA